MKKKLRCPHCGRETITFGDRWFSFSASNGRNNSINTYGAKCPECGGVYSYIGLNKQKKYIEASMILLVYAYLFYLTFFVNPMFVILMVAVALMVSLLIFPLTSLFQPIVVYDRESKQRVIPEANAAVSLDKHVSIKKLMIYGVMTENAAGNVQLTKCFERGIFAAMFLESKQESVWQVYIIKKEFVPDEVLQSGQRFTLTFKGEEVGQGQFL